MKPPMSAENQNEPLRWIAELDALENIPGETPHDKTKSWDRLYNRLGKKSVKRSLFVYWSAAACLVLILAATWLYRTNNHEQLITKIPARKESQAVNPRMKENDEPAVPATVQLMNHPSKSDIRKPLSKALKITDADTMAVITPKEENIAEQSSNDMDMPVQADSAVLMADVRVKKKLRVVHINNIGKPREDEIPYAASSGRSGHYSTHHSVVVSRNDADDILKIKLSPSN
jgi:hypothetical protein